jgi:alkanesulfonate monooxygenase SsuD/methylene tetrahydromethanopterin reductase-like flavin-dependent oxidoreductase (luciferase family)
MQRAPIRRPCLTCFGLPMVGQSLEDAMQFGIFDHLDRYDAPLARYYEDRLRLVELYDRHGFYAYHLAEHHSTPLGMAPSPMLFLASVAQRTKRLRFGPLVLALPLYHPLRVAEEICMLDQLSNGRLDVGFGRGSSPIELMYYGQSPDTAQEIYAESLELIVNAMSQPVLTHSGKAFQLTEVPREIAPLQQPHPPIWYGVHSPDSARRAAQKGLNTVSLDPPEDVRRSTDAYVEVWRDMHGTAPTPLLGIGRFIVLADTDAAAVALARRAYPKWHDSFTHLFRKHGRQQQHPRPSDFDTLMARGQGIAGTPATVSQWLAAQIDATGANYFVGQFAFGDLTPEECHRSIDLFANDVMPKFRASAGLESVA